MKDYAALISAAIRISQDSAPRSMQSAAGIIGPSDIGFCRQKATLMTKGIQRTDSPPKWSALVGTAIHNEVEAAIKETYPTWLVGSIDKVRVTASLPSGVEISGHPDIVVPSDNAVIDIKTVDGFDWVKREGTSRQHKYQRHLYAIGLCQQGILDDSKTVLVGNLYFDRSGKEPDPLLRLEEIDWSMTDEIDSWIGDVIYAVKHGEDASRDIPSPVCERICEYFTVCRGGLEVHDGGQFIEDQELVAAVRMFAEGRSLESEGKRLKDAAKEKLAGVNGSTGEWDVRWTEVQPAMVESFQRPGYLRLDVRKSRR